MVDMADEMLATLSISITTKEHKEKNPIKRVKKFTILRQITANSESAGQPAHL